MESVSLRFLIVGLAGLLALGAISCFSGTDAVEPAIEGGVLPNGHRFFSSPDDATPVTGPAITVEFPGLGSVTAELREDDGNPGSASGTKLETLGGQSDSAVFTGLEAGSYDVVLKQGAATAIADSVVVSDSPVVVDFLYSTLEINFGSLQNVRVELRKDDGEDNAVGSSVWSINGQQGVTTYPTLAGSYDVRLILGAARLDVHAIDCSSSCSLSGISQVLTIDFGGLTGVRMELRDSDGSPDSVGSSVWSINNQSGLVSYEVLKDTYDLRFILGAARHDLHAVDCVSSFCSATGISKTLTVDYGGLTGVRLELRDSDGSPDSVGSSVWSKNNQSGISTYEVLKDSYDLRFILGAARYDIHGIECISIACSAGGISQELTVDFGGLAGVRLELRDSDGSDSSVGSSVWSKNNQTGVSTYEVLKDSYDLRFKHGAALHDIHGVECAVSDCSAGGISQELTVDFGGLSGVRLELRDGNGNPDSVGSSVWSKNNQTGISTYEVLKDNYDLRFKLGAALFDLHEIECATSDCSAGGISQTLSVDFGGLTGVRLELRNSDGSDSSVGSSVWSKNNQSGVSTYEVLNDSYDLRFKLGAATYDVHGADCSGSDCSVGDISQTLSVDYSGLTGIRLELRDSDENPSSVGSSVWSKNGQSGVIEYEVLRHTYDLRFKQAAATYDVHGIGCETSDCSVNNISETLTVNLGDTTGARLELRNSDGNPGTVGSSVWSINGQSGAPTFETLRDIYDLKIIDGSDVTIIDSIDCRSSACSAGGAVEVATPTPTPSPTPTPTATSVPTLAPTATSTPAPTATSVATVEPTATSEAEATATATALPTSTPSPTATPTVEPTATLEPSATATPQPFVIPTSTPTPAPTQIPVPGMVQDLQATAGDGEAYLSWQPGTGSGITGYRVFVVPDAVAYIVDGSTTEMTITGLENGVTYRFQVRAQNASGFGQASLSDGVTPMASATPGPTQAPTQTPSPTATPQPTSTPVPAPQPTATATPISTATAVPTSVPAPQPSSTPTPTATSMPPTPAPTATATATATPTPEPVDPTNFTAIGDNPSIGITDDGVIVDYSEFWISSSEE